MHTFICLHLLKLGKSTAKRTVFDSMRSSMSIVFLTRTILLGGIKSRQIFKNSNFHVETNAVKTPLIDYEHNHRLATATVGHIILMQ